LPLQSVVALAGTASTTVTSATSQPAGQVGAQIDDDVREGLSALLTLSHQEQFGGSQVQSQRRGDRPQHWLLDSSRELDQSKCGVGQALGLPLAEELTCVGS